MAKQNATNAQNVESTEGEQRGQGEKPVAKQHAARKSAQGARRAAKTVRAHSEQNRAQEARDNRHLVTFGPAYIKKVIAGVETDYGKILSHAVALGFGQAAKLRKLSLESLRSMVASAVKTKAGKQVKRTTYIH